jgi:hypothetical protein
MWAFLLFSVENHSSGDNTVDGGIAVAAVVVVYGACDAADLPRQQPELPPAEGYKLRQT